MIREATRTARVGCASGLSLSVAACGAGFGRILPRPALTSPGSASAVLLAEPVESQIVEIARDSRHITDQ